jgi:hypothetical protein
MSAFTPIQARNVPFAVGTDGITYKNLVCKKVWGLTMTPTITEEETDCGIATGVGAVKFSFNFEIVLNTTLAGATEISANQMMAFVNAGTLLYILLQSGSDYIRRGSGYISNYQESAPQGGLISATGTITGNGTIATV